MEHIIKQATPDDCEAILRIYAHYVLNTAISFETELPSAEAFRLRVKGIAEHYPFLLYLVDGEVVGYAYASRHAERAAYRYDVDVSIYISEKHHGTGIAAALYDRLFNILVERGFYNAYVTITLPNEKSTHFHKKFGFTEVGVYHKTGYKLGKWHDVVVMEKTIQAHAENPAPITI